MEKQETCKNEGREVMGRKREIKVAGAIIMKDGRVLIAKRSYGKRAGQWEFPGGKLEQGETPTQCLMRELEEEMGIKADIGVVLADYCYDYEDMRVHMYFVKVNGYKGEIRLRDHAAVEWVMPADIKNYDLLPADVRFAEFLGSGGEI